MQMKEEQTQIDEIPSIIYGERSDSVFLFVHGQGGNKEDAESFAGIVTQKGWQVLSIDLPEHGVRKQETDRFYPWVAVPELQQTWNYMQSYWGQIALRANSIGAWFSMLAFHDRNIVRSLFVSPILDMEHLIYNMMQCAGVTEAQLEAEKVISTAFGQTLSWKYFLYAREHPISVWNSETRILYGSEDNLTERSIVDTFVRRFHCGLTVMEDGEHWFHTAEQLSFLNKWTKQSS